MAKKALPSDAQQLIEQSIRAWAQGAERAARHLATDIEELYERGDWRNRRRPGGERFATFREYAEFSAPHGLGLNLDCGCLTVDAVATRIAAEVGRHRAAVRYLGCQASDGSKSPAGNQKARKNKGENRRGSSPSVFLKAKRCGTTDQQRLWLQIHHPAIWKRLQGGEFRTVNAAMVAAGQGVVHSSHADRCRRSWNRMSAAERRSFLADVKAAGNGNIPAPTK